MVPATLCSTHPYKLQGDEFEALLLESFDYLSDEAPLDSVGFDHEEGPLSRFRHGSRKQGEYAEQRADHTTRSGRLRKIKGGRRCRHRIERTRDTRDRDVFAVADR